MNTIFKYIYSAFNALGSVGYLIASLVVILLIPFYLVFIAIKFSLQFLRFYVYELQYFGGQLAKTTFGIFTYFKYIFSYALYINSILFIKFVLGNEEISVSKPESPLNIFPIRLFFASALYLIVNIIILLSFVSMITLSLLTFYECISTVLKFFNIQFELPSVDDYLHQFGIVSLLLGFTFRVFSFFGIFLLRFFRLKYLGYISTFSDTFPFKKPFWKNVLEKNSEKKVKEKDKKFKKDEIKLESQNFNREDNIDNNNSRMDVEIEDVDKTGSTVHNVVHDELIGNNEVDETLEEWRAKMEVRRIEQEEWSAKMDNELQGYLSKYTFMRVGNDEVQRNNESRDKLFARLKETTKLRFSELWGGAIIIELDKLENDIEARILIHFGVLVNPINRGGYFTVYCEINFNRLEVYFHDRDMGKPMVVGTVTLPIRKKV